MKKLWIGSGVIVALVVAAVAFWPVAATGQGAFVLNKADGLACLASLPPNFYFGPAVLVITPSGNVTFDCNASLILGPGVSRGTVTRGVGGPLGTTCQVTETPSGNANATCH